MFIYKNYVFEIIWIYDMSRLRLPVILATALTLAGCQMDVGAPELGRFQGRRITIKATYESPGPDTKTVLRVGDDGKEHVYWTPGDAISLFYGSGSEGGSKFVAQATEETRVTNFSGEIGVVTGGDEITEDATYFWGLYPYDPTAVCDGQTITVRVADTQVGFPDTFSPGYAPSLGHDQGLMLAFRNVYCGLWFTVTQEGFRSATIRSNGGEPIAGLAKVGIGSDGNPKVQQFLESKTSVTVTAPGPEGFIPGKKYYVLFFPQTLEDGFTVELNSASQTGRFVVSSSIPFIRNQISSIVNFDTKATFSGLSATRADFPDENFANYVFSNFDRDGDGTLSVWERTGVKSIGVWTDDIASVEGIGYFPNLEELSCSGSSFNYVQRGDKWVYEGTGQLSALDVSGNPKLRTLICSYNNMTSPLDLSGNAELRELDCQFCGLTSLDVSGCTYLERLNCQNNSVASLDLTHNGSLFYLWCSSNPLTELDLSHNPLLETLVCLSLKVTSFDLSCNPALTQLECCYNRISNLNLEHQTSLGYLDCAGCDLTVLDLSHNPAIVYLDCSDQPISSLDVSHLESLDLLWCKSTQLSALDLTHNPNLRDLICWYNQLEELDLSGNPKLQRVMCSGNPIASLSLSNSVLLQTLDCSDCLLATLDIGENTNLRSLNCSGNPLQTIYMTTGQTIDNMELPAGTVIDRRAVEGVTINESTFPDKNFRKYVSSNIDLNGDGILSAGERALVTSIDLNTDNIKSMQGIEFFGNLDYLSCQGTGWIDNGFEQMPMGVLTSLDVSQNTGLRCLYCGLNQLTELDVSNNPYLEDLRCNGNKIKSLDLTHNLALWQLACGLNEGISFDVSYLPKLRILQCEMDGLTSLDLSHNPLLEEASFYYNPISEIDLSHNPALIRLNCYGTYLSSLDVSHNPSLQSLDCEQCDLTELDVSCNGMLESLFCPDNPLERLYIPAGQSFQQFVLPDGVEVLASRRNWSVTGAFNGWAEDLDMTETSPGVWVSPEFNGGDSGSGGFKLRQDHGWAISLGGEFKSFGQPFTAVRNSGEISVPATGMVRVTLDATDAFHPTIKVDKSN